MNFPIKFLILIASFMLVNFARAEPPGLQLQQLLTQLQASPDDDALRARVVKIAMKIKPGMTLPDEAASIRADAQIAIRTAKSPAEYLVIANQYEKVIAAAPWVLSNYYELCTIYKKAEKYGDAKKSCEFFRDNTTSAEASNEARSLVIDLNRELKNETDFFADMSAGKIFKDCAECLDLVVIPPGSFEMGSINGQADEQPVHPVTLDLFAIGKTEVTQGQWRAVMGSNHKSFGTCGDDCPVEVTTLDWYDAEAFIEKLNAMTGQQYRLPSESEWEYACKAGAQHEYCGGDNLDEVGWHDSNSNGFAHPVGLKQANGFGLYDMSGNVWEWVGDSGHENYDDAPTDGSVHHGDFDNLWRVLRGGAWNVNSYRSRSAFRLRCIPNFPMRFGFRVARGLAVTRLSSS
jgi:formylglycine-generating enzyme required for sulfatase activity